MSTSLINFVAEVKADLTIDGVALFTTDEVELKAKQSLPVLNADIDTAYLFVVVEPFLYEVVEPTLTGEHYLMWKLLTKIYLYRVRMIEVSERVSFKSADKSMDRSKELSNWLFMLKDLQAEYDDRRERLDPNSNFVVLTTIPGAVYSRGCDTEYEDTGCKSES